jgi:hypothetical protein
MMSTPEGMTGVNPFTTLMAASGMSAAELGSKLGLGDNFDFNGYDPIKAMKEGGPDAALMQKAFTMAQQIYAVIQTAATLADKAGGEGGLTDITKVAQAIAQSIANSNGGDFSATLSQATTAALNAALQGHENNPDFAALQTLSSSLNNALATVTSAIADSYAHLADALQSGNAEAVANAVAVAGLSQGALVNAVNSGDTGALGDLSDATKLQEKAAAYANAYKEAMSTADRAVTSEDLLKIAEQGLRYIDSAHITLKITPEELAKVLDHIDDALSKMDTPEELQKLGIDRLDVTTDSAELSELEAKRLIASKLGFVSSDNVKVTAGGQHMHATLKGLQQLGADQVIAAAGSGNKINLDLGTGSFTTGALPGFHSDADVTLNINLDQLSEVVAHADDLGNAHIDQIDVVGDQVQLTEAQALALSHGNLSFIAGDNVTLQVEGTTHLKTSLTNLQKLGVDSVVSTTGTGALHVALGTGSIGAGALPVFEPGKQVVLDIEASQLEDVLSHADALHQANIDVIDIAGGVGSLTDDQAASLIHAGLQFADDNTGIEVVAQGTHLETSFKQLKALGVDSVVAAGGVHNLHVALGAGNGALPAGSLPVFDHDLDVTLDIDGNQIGDVIGSADSLLAAGIDHLNGVVSIDEAQAATLLHSGLDFVDQADVTLQAEGTTLSTSFKQLQKLGVDTVSTGAGVHTLNVALGHGDLNEGGGALPHFNDDLDVKLHIADGQLQDVIENAQALHAAGIDQIDAASPVFLTEADASALVNAGLDFVAGDDVTLQVAGTELHTSFKQLQKLGVDSVITTGAGHALHVTLGDIGDLSAGALPTFAHHLDVTLHVANDQLAEVANYASLLKDAGIDRIDSIDTVHISDEMASHIIDAGLNFVANDHVIVDAVGTHLHTSFNDLQNLGVDSVTGDHGQTVVVHLGSEPSMLAGHDVPKFDNDLDVRLQVSADQFDATLAKGEALDTANIDRIEITSDAPVEISHLGGAALVQALQEAGIHEGLYLGAESDVKITDLQAEELLKANLLHADASADVTITDQSGVAGEALDVTLAQLASLGADHVELEHRTDVVVDLGIHLENDGTANAELESLLSQFTDGTQLFKPADHVTLDLGNIDVNNIDDEHLITELKLLGIDELTGMFEDEHGVHSTTKNLDGK